MRKIIILLIMGGALLPDQAVAEPNMALGCITAEVMTREQGEKVTQITNVCKYDVKIFWCLNGGDKADYQCGQKGKFFKWATVLAPGQKRQNQYSLPADIPIRMEACWGRRGKDDGDGSVTCPAPPLEDVRTSDDIACDTVMSSFVVFTPRPGVYRFESSDGSQYTYRTLKDGKDLPLDVEKVRKDICKVEAGPGIVSDVINAGRAIIKKSAKEHAAKVLAECLARYDEKSCKPYAHQAGSISG